ncbi:hypothetical protein ACWPXP_06740 [Enterococcus faecalis]
MAKLNWSKKIQICFFLTQIKKGTFWGYRYPYYNSLKHRKEASKRGFESERAANKALLKNPICFRNTKHFLHRK